MYKLLLQPKENNVQPKRFSLRITSRCLMQKAPAHKQQTMMPENRKQRGIIQISFVQRSEVKRHTQIKTQYPLIFTIVCNSGNVLKNKLSKYLTSKKTNLVIQYYH